MIMINSLNNPHKTVATAKDLRLHIAKLDQVKVEELPPTPHKKSPTPGCVNQGPKKPVTPPPLQGL